MLNKTPTDSTAHRLLHWPIQANMFTENCSFTPSVSPIAAQLKIWGRPRAKPFWFYFKNTLRFYSENFYQAKHFFSVLLCPYKPIIELAIFKVQKDWKLACSAKICLWISPQHVPSRHSLSLWVLFLLNPSLAKEHILPHHHLSNISVYSCYKVINVFTKYVNYMLNLMIFIS